MSLRATLETQALRQGRARDVALNDLEGLAAIRVAQRERAARARIASRASGGGVQPRPATETGRLPEKVAHEAEMLLDALLRQAPDCIKLVGLDGRLLYITHRGCEMLELDDPKQLEGSDWVSLWPRRERSKVREAMARAARGEEDCFQAVAATALGTEKHWEVRVAPMHDRHGRIAAIVATSRDISLEMSIVARIDGVSPAPCNG